MLTLTLLKTITEDFGTPLHYAAGYHGDHIELLYSLSPAAALVKCERQWQPHACCSKQVNSCHCW
jgi:hypothetical protein